MSSLDMFLKEIKQYPLLSAQEELELGKKMKDGDMSARERLINHNLRLVVSCAKRYQDRGVEISELISAGYEGLIVAVDKYDYSRGLRFSTNAVYWIQNSLNRCVSNFSRTIRFPVHVWEKINKMRKFQTEYLNYTGIEASVDIIAKHLKMSNEEVNTYLNYATSQILSLNETYDGDEDNELEQVLEDKSAIKAFDTNFQHDELCKSLRNVLETLTPQEKSVIISRFGLFGNQRETLEELGKKWNLSRERIRQIEIHAIRKMRHPARNGLLREYLEES